jgi:hypothetical protein
MLSHNLRRSTSEAVPIFISSSVNRTTVAANTVTAPIGILDGDYLVAVCINVNNNTVTVPSGFTVQSANTGAGMAMHIYAKVASSESGNYLFTWSGTSSNTIAIMVYRACDSVNLAGVKASSSTSTQTAASITPTMLGTLCAVFSQNSTNTVVTPPSGMTLQVTYNAASPGLYIYDRVSQEAAATGDKTLTLSGSAQFIAKLFQLTA